MEQGYWLTIDEYTRYRGISVSTVRRYIRGNRVKYKFFDKKYLIFVSKENYEKKPGVEQQLLSEKLENERLKLEIKILKEELSDLKMLVQIYESTNKDEISAQP